MKRSPEFNLELAEYPKTKRCSKCTRRKPIEDFHTRMLRGKPYVTARCKTCVVEDVTAYQKANPETYRVRRAEWYAKNAAQIAKGKQRNHRNWHRNRLAYLAELKRNPCTDCGVSYDPVCMDFDHLPQFGKSWSISRMAHSKFTDDEVMDELMKCELVCANCHRLRTSLRR